MRFRTFNNVYNNPIEPDGTRWIAYPRPQVIFQYYHGKTGHLAYAESVLASPRKTPAKANGKDEPPDE